MPHLRPKHTGAWATSLAQSVKERLPGLRLAGSLELVCGDPVCMKFGEVCLCRLSMALSRLQHVRHLDMSNCNLHRLPEIWKMPNLETLDASYNQLDLLPAELSGMASLRAVRVVGNPMLHSVPKQLQPLLMDQLDGTLAPPANEGC
mmetsp:Transcript_5712/g.13249  ORF Transcript_5712/g.13249 Transcript_5712/m.13249 type:complete len:147 (-) Transcript_5712:391-831(-)|eukprot:CAMPEP_0119363182 /NCGR_PEP_ID=MMETSP1334-20130426/10072_1 /TAXON_ID=127549 /ORGANISM="Calcidiscus leptoporus, Strain RCC1130" /LENGTH=146 /DNA_ID=CAMNT_0007378555 /DNA_START=32 /DNA_END=472 /DNA_ORIENTATION=-